MEDPAVLEVCIELGPELTSEIWSGSLGYRFSPVPVKKETVPRVLGSIYMQ